MMLYDPERIKTPMRRTNPEKGIGVDPKWKEISWDEAVNEIAGRMKELRDKRKREIFCFEKGFNLFLFVD